MSAIPDYYGMNTDSFRDCITLDIEIPATIYIEGIDSLPKDLKEESIMPSLRFAPLTPNAVPQQYFR